MRRLTWALLLAACLLAQAGPLARHLPPEVRPDPVLLLAIFAAARAEPAEALGFCWAAGLARDLLSAGPLGQYALLYLAVGMGMAQLRKLIDARLAIVQAASAFLAYSFVEGMGLAITALALGNREIVSNAGALISGALVTAAVAPLACWGLGLLQKPLGLKRRRWAGAG